MFLCFNQKQTHPYQVPSDYNDIPTKIKIFVVVVDFEFSVTLHVQLATSLSRDLSFGL